SRLLALGDEAADHFDWNLQQQRNDPDQGDFPRQCALHVNSSESASRCRSRRAPPVPCPDPPFRARRARRRGSSGAALERCDQPAEKAACAISVRCPLQCEWHGAFDAERDFTVIHAASTSVAAASTRLTERLTTAASAICDASSAAN